MEGSCVADDDASQKLKARESTSDASHEEQSETCSLYPKLRPSGGGNSHDSSQYPKPEKVALATVGTTLKSNIPSKMGLKSKKEAMEQHEKCLSKPVQRTDRKSTRLNSSHTMQSRMPSSA